MSKLYITYGKGNMFRKDLLPRKEELAIADPVINKIFGTLWGSPVDAEFGWKDWCIREEFHTDELNTHFVWKLKAEAKVLVIEDLQDVYDKVPFIEKPLYEGCNYTKLCIDYKKILETYDAMELCNGYIGHMFRDEKEMCF